MQGRGGGLIQDDDGAALKRALEERSNGHHGKNQNQARSDLHLALELGSQEMQELTCLATVSKYHFPILTWETLKNTDLLECRKCQGCSVWLESFSFPLSVDFSTTSDVLTKQGAFL